MSTPETVSPIRRWKSRLTRVLTAGVFVVIGWTALRLTQRYDLPGMLVSGGFAMATALAIIYRVINPMGWTLVLAGMGYRVGIIDSIRIWLHAESRRWLPGGIWGYTSRATAASEVGVGPAAASASMMVELLVTMAAAGVVGLFGLLIHHRQWSDKMEQWEQRLAVHGEITFFAFMTVATMIGMAFVFRHGFMWQVRSVVIKINGADRHPHPTSIFLAVGYMVAMAILNGLVNSSLVPVVAPDSYVPLPAMVAATAAAWLVGLLAFFSPGGVLVREAMLAALLAPWMRYEDALLLAVLSRLAQLTAEVVGMLLSVAASLRRTPGVDTETSLPAPDLA